MLIRLICCDTGRPTHLSAIKNQTFRKVGSNTTKAIHAWDKNYLVCRVMTYFIKSEFTENKLRFYFRSKQKCVYWDGCKHLNIVYFFSNHKLFIFDLTCILEDCFLSIRKNAVLSDRQSKLWISSIFHLLLFNSLYIVTVWCCNKRDIVYVLGILILD